MVSNIISMLADMLSGLTFWFSAIMDRTGMLGMFLFGFVIYNVFRLLVKPLVGSGSSDGSSKKAAQYRDAKRKE